MDTIYMDIDMTSSSGAQVGLKEGEERFKHRAYS